MARCNSHSGSSEIALWVSLAYGGGVRDTALAAGDHWKESRGGDVNA